MKHFIILIIGTLTLNTFTSNGQSSVVKAQSPKSEQNGAKKRTTSPNQKPNKPSEQKQKTNTLNLSQEDLDAIAQLESKKMLEVKKVKALEAHIKSVQIKIQQTQDIAREQQNKKAPSSSGSLGKARKTTAIAETEAKKDVSNQKLMVMQADISNTQKKILTSQGKISDIEKKISRIMTNANKKKKEKKNKSQTN